MTWNYRIIEFPPKDGVEGYRALHEVHYDDDGKPVAYSENAATFGEGAEQEGELIGGLELALGSVRKYEVLHVSVFGGDE